MKRKLMKNLLLWKKKKDRKPLLVKGVRQVGKTHLLKNFGKDNFPQYHYINFEKMPKMATIFEPDLDPKRILSDLSFYLGKSIQVGKDLLIFDEIQECPKALTSLKYFQEEMPKLHLCGAGSLLGLHLNSGSFPVGKVTFETLRPLSFEEFLWATKSKSLPYYENPKKISSVIHEYLWEELKHYFIVGGLPEVVKVYCEKKENLFEAFSEVRKKQDDLLKSYYADIAKHSGKVNAMHIDRVLNSIPAQMSQVHDGSITRYKFRGVVPGITHYDRIVGAIDWLEATGLAVKISIVNSANLPFRAYTKENAFKLLLFDVGILGSMAGLSPNVLLKATYGSYKGYFAENFVAQELLASGQEDLYCWQEKRMEVEFILDVQGEVIPMEVKAGRITKAKSLHIFAEKYRPPFQVIFSGKPFCEKPKIKLYPLYLAGKYNGYM
ncbi:MAG: AAA family ATPase [Candidatus Algichlamydia australiensis]|nr:AAA family ATPase [Chlamydiales bacterium]